MSSHHQSPALGARQRPTLAPGSAEGPVPDTMSSLPLAQVMPSGEVASPVTRLSPSSRAAGSRTVMQRETHPRCPLRGIGCPVRLAVCRGRSTTSSTAARCRPGSTAPELSVGERPAAGCRRHTAGSSVPQGCPRRQSPTRRRLLWGTAGPAAAGWVPGLQGPLQLPVLAPEEQQQLRRAWDVQQMRWTDLTWRLCKGAQGS